MRRSVLVFSLFVVSLVHSVVSLPGVKSWTGEWGVHIASGLDTSFLESLGFTVVKRIGNLQDAYIVKHSELTTQHPSHLIEAAHATLQNHEHVVFTDKMYKKRMYTRGEVTFPDPLFPNQWHLNNTGQQNGTVGQDINVTGAWNLGYSGFGVRIAIVDDGYQHAHPDLAPGYRQDSSYNINAGTPDPAPGPYDSHGTAAAGVALAANNSVCGVGAAFGAAGSGIRLIADSFSDADTAAALHFTYNLNDIYSNSWGPVDDGNTVEGPGYFTLAAMEDGIKNGRNGKGSIYVWAAGNGLMNNDNCNYDGFANHRATIAVGAVGNDGKYAYYSEPCAAMLVTAPSSSYLAGITTTDLLGAQGYDPSDCTSRFGGTSSACPLAAGVIALMLEANPSLTWRDVQYILLSTADQNDPTDIDWTVNGAGYHINHKYGFGRVNAFAAVQAAVDHDSLYSYKVSTYNNLIVNETIPDNDIYTGLNKSVHISSELLVEHVEVTVSIPNFLNAGDLKIILTSPSGTKSVLAEQHGTGFGLFLSLPSIPGSSYACGYCRFGPAITNTPITGEVVIVPTSCGNITDCDSLQGKVALIDYTPSCNFTLQVHNVEQCGAILALISYRYVGPPFNLPNDGEYNVTIPSAMVPFEVAMLMKDEIEANGNVSMSIANQTYRAEFSYDGWTFSTVRNWGESAKGTWTLQVFDTLEGAEGTFASWDLAIYGHSKPYKMPYWIVGIIVGAILIVIFATAIGLYVRSKSDRLGYRQMP